MKYRIELELPENKLALTLEFLKSLSWMKAVSEPEGNTISRKKILKSIEDYEQGKSQPVPMSLEELKALLNA
jgi:hypothetical protein